METWKYILLIGMIAFITGCTESVIIENNITNNITNAGANITMNITNNITQNITTTYNYSTLINQNFSCANNDNYMWNISIVDNVFSAACAADSTGGAPSVKLSDLLNPSAHTNFDMGAWGLNFTFTGIASKGITIEGTGNFVDDLLHIHQDTGNIGAGVDLVHIETADTDGIGINLSIAGKNAIVTNSNITADTFIGKITEYDTAAITAINQNSTTFTLNNNSVTGYANSNITRLINAINANSTTFTLNNASTAGYNAATYATITQINQNSTLLTSRLTDLNDTKATIGNVTCIAGYYLYNITINKTGIYANCAQDSTGTGGASSGNGWINSTIYVNTSKIVTINNDTMINAKKIMAKLTIEGNNITLLEPQNLSAKRGVSTTGIGYDPGTVINARVYSYVIEEGQVQLSTTYTNLTESLILNNTHEPPNVTNIALTQILSGGSYVFQATGLTHQYYIYTYNATNELDVTKGIIVGSRVENKTLVDDGSTNPYQVYVEWSCPTSNDNNGYIIKKYDSNNSGTWIYITDSQIATAGCNFFDNNWTNSQYGDWQPNTTFPHSSLTAELTWNYTGQDITGYAVYLFDNETANYNVTEYIPMTINQLVADGGGYAPPMQASPSNYYRNYSLSLIGGILGDVDIYGGLWVKNTTNFYNPVNGSVTSAIFGSVYGGNLTAITDGGNVLRKTGGQMTGNITFTGRNGISWTAIIGAPWANNSAVVSQAKVDANSTAFTRNDTALWSAINANSTRFNLNNASITGYMDNNITRLINAINQNSTRFTTDNATVSSRLGVLTTAIDNNSTRFTTDNTTQALEIIARQKSNITRIWRDIVTQNASWLDINLSINTITGNTYFTCSLIHDTAATTTGIEVNVTYTGAAANAYTYIRGQTSVSAYTSTSGSGVNTNLSLLTSGGSDFTETYIRGMINGSAGQAQIRVRAERTVASNVIIRQGSFCDVKYDR